MPLKQYPGRRQGDPEPDEESDIEREDRDFFDNLTGKQLGLIRELLEELSNVLNGG